MDNGGSAIITDRALSTQCDMLIESYLAVRKETANICRRLEKEDHAVQPTTEVSPPKWHMGHTSWFFEELILVKFLVGYKRFNDQYRILFNSYYKSAGEHWIQAERGHLSRPTVEEIGEYRAYVDKNIVNMLQNGFGDSEVLLLLELGLHHEQQHQELLYMDIKYILGVNPLLPAYIDTPRLMAKPVAEKWKSFDEGVYEVGHNGQGFAYDNESPNHKVYIYPFVINEKAVTNGDYLEFINEQGYVIPKYWLSLGWDWVRDNHIQCPLYWKRVDGEWCEFTLHGLQVLDLDAPVTHVSYFEANAYANWKGCRLPTEQELEIYLMGKNSNSYDETCGGFHPYASDIKVGQVWCWSSSHYSPYPGYKCYRGKLEEYNGKFMCNQFVLKGGCITTPKGHHRASYRNFYQPHQRWMFSGIRLAKDVM